jgi:hypothetical protein
MSRISQMGIALRELCGEGGRGDGPIEVMTRLADFNVVTVDGPQGPVSAPANSLIAFTAQSFRELRLGDAPCDVWEFRVQAPVSKGSGQSTWATMYVAGADVFLVRAPSKVAL